MCIYSVAMIIFQHLGVQLMADEICHWNIECGKPLTEICSSRFCDKTLLASYREFLHNIEVYLFHISINEFRKFMNWFQIIHISMHVWQTDTMHSFSAMAKLCALYFTLIS